MGRRAVPTGTRSTDPAGYVRIKLPDHPLAVAGWAREHALVLYAQLGPGAHPCHHCGKLVAWGTTLEVDHLDRNRQNNDAANLVAACRLCNNARRRRGGRGDRV
jgi:5-methylcytosine-specific restriction endonuclease McrA